LHFGFSVSHFRRAVQRSIKKIENGSKRPTNPTKPYKIRRGPTTAILDQIAQPTPQADNRGSEAPEVTFIGLKLGEGLLVFVTVWLVLVTKALVDGSKETAERQLRAYVHTIGKDFVVQGADGDRFVNRFSVVNAGQTPAYKLQIDSVVKVLPRPLTENFEFAFIPEGLNRSVMMVGPGRSVGHDSLADAILSPAEMIRIMSADSGVRLYSYGTIRYEDCFGHPRFTDFCYFLEWEVTAQGYTFSVHPTEQHNDAN
jgi:hypothetical protein